MGNRRLAIIDPTPAGHQPMYDADRGTVIVFNGMIYNYRELQAQLVAQGERFVSECDTEVVLKAYGTYGADCVRHLQGMFAFAVWDSHRQEMFLARDRLGIKPLYYWQQGSTFLFASQVQALLSTGRMAAHLSQAGIATYLAYGAVSEPLTAIDGVLALPAAHVATVRAGKLSMERYWSPFEVSQREFSREDAARELGQRLDTSVRRHLVSDAPLGVFLSGGMDSSVLAALGARHTSRVKTLSVVFDEPAFSEKPFMESVAGHIGSEHFSVTLRSDDLLSTRDAAFRAMDQPTVDGMNTYTVSRVAATCGIKVALSGLGADELFDGYGYVRRMRSLMYAGRLPRVLAPLAETTAGLMMRRGNREKMAAWISGRAGTSPYDLLRRLFLQDEVWRLSGSREAAPPATPDEMAGPGELANKVCLLELTNYLKNMLLRDTDAMSMAHSVEVRVPYLDDAFVEFVLSLPPGCRAGGGKSLLAEATRSLLPPEIFARRKQGFVLPLAGWMQGELRSEVEATLRQMPEPLAEMLDAGTVTAVWDEFARDGRRWQRPWALYSLCQWVKTLTAGIGTPH
jgi:asparagine synthase (glutamine-hydrolysing)